MPQIKHVTKTLRTVIVLNIVLNIWAVVALLYVIWFANNIILKFWLICSFWEVLNIALGFFLKFKIMPTINIRSLRLIAYAHFVLFIVLFCGMLILLICTLIWSSYIIEDIADIVFVLELFGMVIGFFLPFVMLVPASKKTVNLLPDIFG